MVLERVPRWRLGYTWIPYWRVGQAAYCLKVGPFRLYWPYRV